MSGDGSQHVELCTLMDQALETCIKLQGYTAENFDVFRGDDDAKIAEVIDYREKLVEALTNIEYKADLIMNDNRTYNSEESIPQDVEERRRSVRAVLRDVLQKDMEIMKIISRRMQIYKVETLRARNKKNISAYMRTSFSTEPGDSVDFKK